MRIKEIPIGKRFEVYGVEFYIDTVMGRGTNYTCYCITDHKNLCSRAKLETIAKRIEERTNK